MSLELLNAWLTPQKWYDLDRARLWVSATRQERRANEDRGIRVKPPEEDPDLTAAKKEWRRLCEEHATVDDWLRANHPAEWGEYPPRPATELTWADAAALAAKVKAIVGRILARRGEPPAGAQPSEGGKPKPAATTEAILPVLLSASDIANRIQKNPKSVTSFLSRFAEKSPDCRVETESKRKNEPGYLYRTADVWPALEKWMKDGAEN